MGRSGGGFSSGGRSHGGGGRSGGFSGGGSIGGGNHGGFHGGHHHGWSHHHHRPMFFGGWGRGYYRPWGYGGGCGCLAPVLVILAICIVLGAFGFLNFDGNTSNAHWETNSRVVHSVESNIVSSAKERKAIDKSLSKQTAWFQDDNTYEYRWINNAGLLESGLQYFFDKTGVRPYLHINTQEKARVVLGMTNAERLAYLSAMYEELFEDEAHALFVISDDGNANYRYDDFIGAQAKRVVDLEAVNILYDRFDYYWETSLEEEALFSSAFHEAADSIMQTGG